MIGIREYREQLLIARYRGARYLSECGVIAEFVPKRTLSSIEERGAGISQRTKPILERFGRPDVVAIEADV